MPDHLPWSELVELAVRAPSGGNAQPWRFVVRADGRLHCFVDPARAESFLDVDHLAAHLALGCAVESMVLAAAARGLEAEVETLADVGASPPHPVCRVRLGAAADAPPNEDVELAAQLERRATNRAPGSGAPLPGPQLEALTQVARAAGARLQTSRDPRERRVLAEVVAGCERLRLTSPRMHQELVSELRWTPAEAARSGDGIDVGTLEVSAAQRLVLRGLSNPAVVARISRLGFGKVLEGLSRGRVRSASAVALLSVPGTHREAYFRGGRALQRVWLKATALGLGLQPLAVAPYLFARLLRDEVDEELRAALTPLRGRFVEIFDTDPERAEVMLFRLTDGPPPSTRSLRRPATEVLSFE